MTHHELVGQHLVESALAVDVPVLFLLAESRLDALPHADRGLLLAHVGLQVSLWGHHGAHLVETMNTISK